MSLCRLHGRLTAALCVVLLSLAVDDGGAATPPDDLPARAFSLSEMEFFLLDAEDAEIRLAHAFVVSGSVTVTVAGREWRPDEEFRLRAREGIVRPLRPWAGAGAEASLVVVNYRFVPLAAMPQADLHPLVNRPRIERGPEREDGDQPGGDAAEATLPADLDVHGSKMVRVASGSRREMTVDQNLRLTIDGHLTDDIMVRAMLSDDNLPVVPEGTTEELRDVDKVLVEMRAPTWAATLGDFVAQRTSTIYGDYRRKLQGFTVAVDPGDYGVSALAGTPRGAYRTLQIRGEEAKQGPYYLGGSGGANLFIVAGSERVTLDGEEMRRGADRDYVVDYVRGSVTFTYRRLVTAESEIVVEFEEGEGEYARSVVGAGGGATFDVPFFEAASGSLSVRMIREKDNPDRLRSGTLDEADIAALAAAGDDENEAVVGGVTEREPGEGSYRQETLGGELIYVFDHAGDYDLSFFYTGSGGGDYGVDSLTVTGAVAYGYRGDGEGEYRLGRRLALPGSQSLVTVAAGVGNAGGAGVYLEWDVSDEDRNLQSTLDDGNNSGGAVAATARTGEIDLGGGRGVLAIDGRHENRSGRFRPFLMARDRFAYERWGLGDRSGRDGFLEEADVESRVDAKWRLGDDSRMLQIDGGWGRLRHGDTLEAKRWEVGGTWRLAGGDGKSRWTGATSLDEADPLDILRSGARHEMGWRIAGMRPVLHGAREQWRDDEDAKGASGYRRRSWGAALARLPGAESTWKVGFERSISDSLYVAAWEQYSDARTLTCEATSAKRAGMRLSGGASVREVDSPRLATQTTRLARATVTGDWPDLGSQWSLAYRVDNSRAEVLDRQVVWAGTRQGDYNIDGDFVGTNLGDYDLVYAASDSLVATTAVEATVDWRQDFGFLGRESIFGAWRADTRVNARGRSRTDEVGELLRLVERRLFDEDDTVLGEFDLQEDVTLLRHLAWIDLRLLYDYRETMDRQYAAHPENRLRRRWRSHLTWSVTASTSLQARVEQSDEARLGTEGGTSARASYDSSSLSQELEYVFKSATGSRFGLAVEHLTRKDAVSAMEQLEWALHPDLRWRAARRWSVESSLRWSSVSSDDDDLLRPYFYPRVGTNVEASTRVAWDPNRTMTVSLALFARRLGDEGGWQQDVRIESTARF